MSGSHLQSAGEAIANESFGKCVSAAANVDLLLRQYQKHFCVRSAPYHLSYATYVSATIHLRIAAQNRAGSDAHRRLENCLDLLTEHQVLCNASRRCLKILKNLMRRLGVDVRGGCGEARATGGGSLALNDTEIPTTDENIQATSGGSQNLLPTNEDDRAGAMSESGSSWLDLDMDEIIRSLNWDSATVNPGCIPQNLNAGGFASDAGFGESFQVEDGFPNFDALFGVDI